MSYSSAGDLSLVLSGVTYVVSAPSGPASFVVKSPYGQAMQVSPGIAAELYGDYKAVDALNKILTASSVGDTITDWNNVQSSIQWITALQTSLNLTANLPAWTAQWFAGDYANLAESVALFTVTQAPAVVDVIVTGLATAEAENLLKTAQQQYQTWIAGRTTPEAIDATTVEKTISDVVNALAIGENAATAATNIPGVNLNESPLDTFLGWLKSLTGSLLSLGTEETATKNSMQDLTNLLDSQTKSQIGTATDLVGISDLWENTDDAAKFASLAGQLSQSAGFYLLTGNGESATASQFAGNPYVSIGSESTSLGSGPSLPPFQITPESAAVNENSGSVSFTITPEFTNYSGTVYVSTVYDVGTDNPGNDYYYSGILDRPLVFSGGQPVTVSVSIMDRGVTSGSEAFHLIVQGSQYDPYTEHLGEAKFTILNNDPSPGGSYVFSTPTPSVDEDAGLIKFFLSRTDASQPETVYVSTVHDQGTSNPSGDTYYDGLLDYPVTFGVGQWSVPISVTIHDLGLSSGRETFRIIAQQNPSEQTTQFLATENFSIVNSDIPTTYQITPSPATVVENGGSLVFSIRRQGATTKGEWVYVSTEPGQDTNNNNYYYQDLLHEAIYFAPGQAVETAPAILIYDHGFNSGSETFGFIVQQNATDAPSDNLAATTFTIENTDTTPAPLTGTLHGTNDITNAVTLDGQIYLDRENVNGTLVSAVLQNTGTITVLAGGAIQSDGYAGDVVINMPSGTIAIDTSTRFDFMPTFYNRGYMRVSPGNGGTLVVTSYLNYSGLAFDNTGTVEVDTGTFNVYQGGSSSGSGFAVASGATVLFTGALSKPFTFSGGTYSVAGTTQVGSNAYGGVLTFGSGTTVDAGSTWLNYGTIDLSAASVIGAFVSLDFHGGILKYGSQNLTLYNATADSTSAMIGSGTITLKGTSTLDEQLSGGGAVLNYGTVDIPGQLWIQNSSTFENDGTVIGQGGLIADTIINDPDGLLSDNSGVFASTLQNSGRINIMNYSSIANLQNLGSIDVVSGQLYLHDGSTNGSDFSVEAGTTLGVSGTWTLTGGTFAPNGLVVNGGTWVIANSTTITNSVYNAGIIEVKGGTLSMSALPEYAGTVTLDPGASLAISSPGTAGNSIAGFGQVGSFIDILGITANNATVNSSGQLDVLESGTIVAALQLSGSVPAGPFFVTPDGNGGSDITVASGPPPAPFNLDVAQALTNGSGTISTSDATPVVTGNGQAGYTVALYDNSSEIGSGIIDQSGSWSVQATHLGLGVYTIIAKEAQASSGQPGFQVATVSPSLSAPSDPLTLVIAPASISWQSNVSGNFLDPTKWTGGAVPDSNADATIDFADYPLVTHDSGINSVHSITNKSGNFVISGGSLSAVSFNNNSSLSWTQGALVLETGIEASATLDNAAGATLAIAGNGQQLGISGTGTASVTNEGTVTLDGAPGSADLDAPLLNTGTVLLNQGTLGLNAGGSSSGTQLTSARSGTLRFGATPSSTIAPAFSITAGPYAESNTVVDGSTLDLSAATTAAFDDSLQLATGAVQLGGIAASAYGTLTQTGGTLAGAGTLTAAGPVALTGGVQTDSGTTRLIAAATLDGSVQLDGGRSLENDGFLQWGAGSLQLGAGDATATDHSASLTNNGVLDITTPGRIGAPGSGTVTNAGVLLADTGTGEADIDATLHSPGIIQVRSGTLGLNGGGEADSVSVAAGATLRFGAPAGSATGGAFTLHDAVRNAGTIAASAGTLTLTQGASGGAFVLDGSATMDFVNGPDGGSSLGFLQPGGTLEVQQAAPFAATLTGFGGTDVLDAVPVSFATAVATFAGGTLSVGDGTHSAAFQLSGSYAQAGFHLSNDGHGGTAISYG